MRAVAHGFFNINRILLGIIAVIAAAAFMIAVPLLDQPAVADQSAATPTIMPQKPSLEDNFRDFADRMALDRRLGKLEQQIQTLSNTAPTIVPQQPPNADPSQDSADRIALDQRLQRLEQQIETLNVQIQILSNTRGRAAQTRTETFPRSWVRLKQATTKYRHRPRQEVDGTALAGETVDANPAARRGKTNAYGCPASVPCVERRTDPFTASTAKPEYDEAGAEIKKLGP
jgi:TolA-binding protein